MHCSGDSLFLKDLRPLSWWLPDYRMRGVLQLPLLKAALLYITLNPHERRNLLHDVPHGAADDADQAQLWQEVGRSRDVDEVYNLGHEILYTRRFLPEFYSERVFEWRTLVRDYYLGPLRDSF
jgi:hypothetical protein